MGILAHLKIFFFRFNIKSRLFHVRIAVMMLHYILTKKGNFNGIRK